MDEKPELQVRMFLNVQRPHGSQESEDVSQQILNRLPGI
jgi:hypothetical protein